MGLHVQRAQQTLPSRVRETQNEKSEGVRRRANDEALILQTALHSMTLLCCL